MPDKFPKRIKKPAPLPPVMPKMKLGNVKLKDPKYIAEILKQWLSNDNQKK